MVSLEFGPLFEAHTNRRAAHCSTCHNQLTVENHNWMATSIKLFSTVN